MECCIHQDSVTETKIIQLSSIESWKKLLAAAKIRGDENVLSIAKNTLASTYPNIKYHKSCRSLFVNSKSLKRIEEANVANVRTTNDVNEKRSSTRLKGDVNKRECDKLPQQCIFCNRRKMLPKSSTTEKLLSCMEMRADEQIRKCSEERNDQRIMAMCSDELIAKEAKYHKSCYRNYTRELYIRKERDDIIPFVKHYLANCVEEQKIITYKTLTDAVEAEMTRNSDDAIDNYISNIKKNLRQRIENYLPDYAFITIDRVLYVYPTSLTVEDALTEVIVQRRKLKELQQGSESEKLIMKAAFEIRNNIKAMNDTMPWPPSLNDLDISSMHIGDPLSLFMNALLSGSVKEPISTRVIRLKMSIGQDIVYAVSNGKIKTPKSIMYPTVIKSLTNCTELITLNNKLGHGVSKSILEELFTENAFNIIDKQIDEDVMIPDGFSPNKFTITVHDNIDRLEETLSGSGTSHRVNGILIQHGFSDVDHSGRELEPKRKRSRRSFVLPERNDTVQFNFGKRVGPTNLTIPINQERDMLLANQEMHHLLWILTRKVSIPQVIPSWTGINIEIRKGIGITKSSVGYLETIDSPATEITTVYEILDRCLKLKEKLNLDVIICVFDQAIYAKAVEIKWKEPEKYRSCIIMLGMFHMIMMYLGIIGKRFKDGGLRDVFIQSEVISEGSVERALSGKMYNRAVRCNKLLYEALYRLLINKFEEDIDNIEDQIIIDKLLKDLSEFTSEVCSESFENLKEKYTTKQFQTIFTNFKDRLFKHGAPLTKYWLSYLEMVEVLLNTLYAVRTGDWNLLLECIRDIATYAFAYDNYNYARYLTPFLAEMIALETDFPEVYEEFVNGNFVVQLSEFNPFGKVEPDKVIEVTVNRDTKTPGGTTGFSTNSNAINRWILNAPFRAGVRTALQNFVHMHHKAHQHKDLLTSRIRKDENDVNSLMTVLQDTFINPFSDNPVLCISNGMVALENVSNDLLNAKEKGRIAMEMFANERLSSSATCSLFDPMKKLQLKTFSTMKKVVTVRSNKKIVPMKASRNLFSTLCLIMEKRKLDLQDVFRYPLGPFPWSLADGMGGLKKTSKVSILHELEKSTEPWNEQLTRHVSLVDGMALLQKAKVTAMTYGQLANKIFQTIIGMSTRADRIDVVFDTYIDNSIKDAERIQRSSSGSIKFRSIKRDHPVKQWNQFLSVGSNKTEIIEFLVHEWVKNEYFQGEMAVTFYVTSKDNCYKLSSDGKELVEELKTVQEEADTRIFLHMFHAFRAGYTKFLIHSPDTDVFIMALSFMEHINGNVFFHTGTRDKDRIISLETVNKESQRKYLTGDINVNKFFQALLGLYAYTGCDTVSAFAGQGKIKAMKLLVTDKEYVDLFCKVGRNVDLDEQTYSELEAFTCHLYGTKCDDINHLRYKMYCSKRGKFECERLPPCRASLYQHSLRANYQCKVWRSALMNDPLIPSPDGHGWTIDDNGINIKWMECNPAPDEVMELLSCDCKRKCNGDDCPCIDNGLTCTNACKLKDCDNMDVDSDDGDYDTDSSDSELEDDE